MIKLQMGLFEGAFMLHFPAIATGQMVHWLCKHIIIRDRAAITQEISEIVGGAAAV